MKHLGDITKINGAEIEPVDCIVGGSPCQDLSVAGKRAGLAGERSGLFMEQIRIVKEMREHERRIRGTDDDFRFRPRYMVWENVPGAFSSNKGKDFQAVLTEIVRIVRPDAPDVPLPDRGGGASQDASWDTVQPDALFPSLGDYTMRSFGEQPNMLMEECLQEGLPNGVSVSRLSRILEESVPQKYYLSARACVGILNRAAKRGKELPEILKKALETQSRGD